MQKAIKQKQRGDATTVLLIIMGVICAIWLGWDYSPAPATEIKDIVSMSAEVPSAKAKVQEFLTANPSPNNKDFKALKSIINELLVLEEAKKTTGNHGLKSASEQKADLAKATDEMQQTQRQELEAKSLKQMSVEEVATYLMFKMLDWWPLGLFFMFICMAFAGYRKAERGELGF